VTTHTTHAELIMVAIDATEDRPSRYEEARRILADVPVVLIRTRDAGVHFGRLVFVANATGGCYRVVLTNARRIWNWSGANTLHEIALRGIPSGRVAEPVESIALPQVIEILPCTPEAIRSLEKQKWQ